MTREGQAMLAKNGIWSRILSSVWMERSDRNCCKRFFLRCKSGLKAFVGRRCSLTVPWGFTQINRRNSSSHLRFLFKSDLGLAVTHSFLSPCYLIFIEDVSRLSFLGKKVFVVVQGSSTANDCYVTIIKVDKSPCAVSFKTKIWRKQFLCSAVNTRFEILLCVTPVL